MALAFTNLGASANPDIASTSNAGSYANTSWTPPTSGAILAFVSITKNTVTVPACTMSGNGLTWTQIATCVWDNGVGQSMRLSLFAAPASGATTGATTVTITSDTATGCAVSFFQATDIDLSGGISAAFVQSVTAGTNIGGAGNSNAPTITLSAAGNSANRPISGWARKVQEVASPRTNWTEVDDLGYASPDLALESQYRSDAFETTAGATWTTSTQWLGIASEVKAVSGGDASVTPTTVQGATTVSTPSVSGGASVTPTTVQGATTIPTPSVSTGGSANVTPTTVAATTSVPTPTVSGSANVTTTTVSSATTIPTPVVSLGQLVANTDTSALTNDGTANWGNAPDRVQWWNTAQSRWDAVLPLTAPPAAGASDWWIVANAAGTLTTKVLVDARSGARPTIVWDEGNNRLYVLMQAVGGQGGSLLYAYNYNSGTDTYTVDSNVNAEDVLVVGMGGDSNTALHRTPNGNLWVASSRGSAGIVVNRSSDNGATWGTPFQLKATQADGKVDIDHFTNGGTTYVCVANGENGVSASSTIYNFLYIDQGSSGWGTAGNWTDDSSNIPSFNSANIKADDEICMTRDASSNIYITTETENVGSAGSSDEQWVVYKRTPGGTWSKYKLHTFDGNPSRKRPTITVDDTNDRIYVFANTDTNTRILYKTAALSSISALETVPEYTIFDDGISDFRNSHPPANVTADSDLLVFVDQQTADVVYRELLLVNPRVGNVSATTTIPTPTVTTAGGANVTAGNVAATTSIPTPSVSAGVGITAGNVAGVTTIPTPSVSTGAAGLGQPHFRIRTGDTQALNADAGWAAALDTGATIDAETFFRIRFEVESVPNAGAKTFKLQYRRNAGTWTDVPVRAVAENVQTGTDATEIVLSAQYVNDAATTNLLSGSSATFEAGVGLEDNLTPSITLNNEHTEYEWTLRIRASWHNGTTKGRNADGDEFQYRIVESGGTVFPGTYTIPTVTLNMPDGLIGGTHIETPKRMGPFKDANGNLYICLEYGEPNASDELQMLKSTDGGKQWFIMDASNAPTAAQGADDNECMDVQQVGSVLHIAVFNGSNRVRYHTFRTSDNASPDTWGITGEVVANPSPSPSDQDVSIGVRSDGSIVCTYSIGGTDERIGYKIRSTGGVWGSENILDSAAGDHTSAIIVIGASDLAYIFYKDHTASLLYYKTLTSGGTLSGRTQFNPTGTVPQWKAIPAAYYFDDGGTEVIVVAYRRTNLLMERRIRGGVLQTERTISDTSIAAGLAGSLAPVSTIAVRGKDVHAAFVNSAVITLLKYDKSLNGAAYGADTDKYVTTTPGLYTICGNVYKHSAGNGGAIVMAVVVDDGGDGYTGFNRYKEWTVSESGGSSATATPSAVAATTSIPTPTVSVSRVITRSASLNATATPKSGGIQWHGHQVNPINPWGFWDQRAAIAKPAGATTVTGAASHGTTDHTSLLQNAFNAAPTGATIWLDGHFDITNVLLVKDGQTIISNNAHIHGNAAFVSGGQYTAGSTVNGVLLGIDARPGVNVFPTARVNVTVKGIEFSGFVQHGVRPWLGGEVAFCYFHECYGGGIAGGMQNEANPGGGFQAYLHDCIIKNCGSADTLAGSVQFEKTGDGSDLDPVISSHGVLRASTKYGGLHIERIWSEGNWTRGPWMNVASGGDLIENCVSYQNQRDGFRYEASVGPATIRDCTAIENRQGGTTGFGISVTGSGLPGAPVDIEHCRVESNLGNAGIEIRQGTVVAQKGHGTTATVRHNNIRGTQTLSLPDDPSGVDTPTVSEGNADYGTGWGGAFEFTPQETNPFKVKNLVATAVSSTQINLRWDDVFVLEGETYDIERNGVVVVNSYAGSHTTANPYQDTGLTPATSYTYRVRAVGGTVV